MGGATLFLPIHSTSTTPFCLTITSSTSNSRTPIYQDKDREAKWMETSLRWFDGLFQIYETVPGGDDAVRTDADPGAWVD